jgi:DNA-binding transcriptional LysR family regulator
MNLLVVLDALLDEAHVGRAGARVGLSQPATSHALARLRHLFGDALLTRVGTGMVRTPRAEALRKPLNEFVASARALLSAEAFEARTSRRAFRMMLPDLVCHLIAPLLLERLARRAPGVRLDFISWRGPELLTERSLREIDFLVTSIDRDFSGFAKSPLYEDKDILAVRARHPGRRSLSTVRGFSAHRHIAIVGAGEQRDEIDPWLRKVGLVRDVAVTAPNYSVALSIAAASDLVAFVPRRFASTRRRSLGLAFVEPPHDPGVDVLNLYIPARALTDAGALWMKREVEEAARAA